MLVVTCVGGEVVTCVCDDVMMCVCDDVRQVCYRIIIDST